MSANWKNSHLNDSRNSLPHRKQRFPQTFQSRISLYGYLLLLGETCQVTTNTNVKQQLEMHGSVGNDTVLWLLESELSLCILSLVGLLTGAETE